MEDNFRRLVMREPVGTRFVLWAHNFHISTIDSNGTNASFGYYLPIESPRQNSLHLFVPDTNQQNQPERQAL